MPTFIVPHKSGLHRQAAIALFRALLQQCKALNLPVSTRDEFQNIIRHRFKSQRIVTSHRQHRINFAAGYEAIDHLDAAVADDEKSNAYLLDLLAKAPDSVKKAPKNEAWESWQREAKRKECKRAKKEEIESRKIDLFSRPLPLEKLSGERKVPVLFNANHIPVLRLKKPQPKSLSAFLDNRIKQRQRRHDLRQRLEAELQIAKEEDKWEAIVYATSNVDSRPLGASTTVEPRWAEAVDAPLKEVQRLLNEENRKNRIMAEKMQAVVDRETALAEKEKAERDRAKRREK